jgi:hypothetical protein
VREKEREREGERERKREGGREGEREKEGGREGGRERKSCNVFVFCKSIFNNKLYLFKVTFLL